jgi:NADH dehydrogenase
MGKFAAACILGDLHGEPRRPFRYRDKGSLATIGRSSAVADIAGFKLTGPIAWLAWLFIHVLFLIGFRSRVQVLWDWFWEYATFQRGARLITGQSTSIVPTSAGPVQEVETGTAELPKRRIG